MSKSKSERFLEKDIKDFILGKQTMFGDLGKNVVLFEKRLSQTKKKTVKPTIADALIFSEHKGMIGIEIKTEGDNLSRLKRQLTGYSLVCDYIWVVCHDKHVQGVEDRLKRYGFSHVGIIAYTQFKGKVIGGVYKKPIKNFERSVFHQLNILWKVELQELLAPLSNPGKFMGTQGYRYGGGDSIYYPSKSNGGTLKGLYSGDTRKSDIIRNIINLFGEEEASRILCQTFYDRLVSPNRALTMKNFRNRHREGNEDG